MAYICYKKIMCQDCKHYRWDDDRQDMVCYGEQDGDRENELKELAEYIKHELKKREV